MMGVVDESRYIVVVSAGGKQPERKHVFISCVRYLLFLFLCWLYLR